MHPVNQANDNTIRPQNPACPVGDTDEAKGGQTVKPNGQEGVLVTPPLQKYMPPDGTPYTVLHTGFDTIHLSIEANLPHDMFETLLAETQRADDDGEPVLTHINGVQMHVKPHGGKGYALLCNTGDFGAAFAFKTPNAKDPWGVRLIIGSKALAVGDLGRVRAHIDLVCDALGIRYDDHQVSLSRVDICTDIWAPDFTLNPRHFVTHSNTRHGSYADSDSFAVHGTSGRTGSVTLGSSARKQVTIYDKRAEVTAKRKAYWWTIWQGNIDRMIAQGDLPQGTTLDPKDATASRIWHIEFRAGKPALRQWDIKTWSQLFTCYGDLVQKMGLATRYADPQGGETNRSRWPNHPIWEVALHSFAQDLAEMRANVDPSAVKQVDRAAHIDLIVKQSLGCTVTIAALQGVTFDNLEGHIGKTCQVMQSKLRANPDHYAKQLQRAKDRYVFKSPSDMHR
ncbi:hypothetical protein [Nereida sp. MMG025]|uniref:hypothetical protein n=1 Tax=Nereida sp. MMG025 TaxID=2909981 RepID=UPI001F3C1B7A|nr:hypothetical protein [Nereida sp. MMG025]MCF6443695.1 hypothetical protein [Nereida sp. MMG025]